VFAFENDIFLGKENLRNPIMNPSSPLGARYRGKMEMEGGWKWRRRRKWSPRVR